MIKHSARPCSAGRESAHSSEARTSTRRYSLDVQAESTYDAAHLFLTKAKEHVIREPLPIPSLETVFEVTVNGRVHHVPGQNSNDGSTNDGKNGKDHEDTSSTNDQTSDLKGMFPSIERLC